MNLRELKSQAIEKRTKGWVKSFTAFGLIIIFFIYWILFCDPNVLKINWFRSPYFDSKGVYHDGLINLNVVWVLLGIIGVSIIYFIVLKFVIRKADYDLLPFITMPITIGIMLMVSGFIPFNQTNKNWILFARFIIVFLSTIIIFFISIKVTNKILLNSSSASYIYENIKKDYEEMDKIERETKAFVGERKKEKDYIEI